MVAILGKYQVIINYMTRDTVLGIDLGTQSLKVIVYNPATKHMEATAAHALDMQSRSDGSREQKAEDWITALHACFSKLDKGLLASVSAIGVSGQQHGFVPLAADGSVLADVKLWCDTSTQQECHEIMDAVGGEDACRTLSGNSVAVGFTASKIAWLKKHRPDAYADMATILLPHDYLNFHLTGNRVTECGDASGTALLDIRKRSWCPELLAAVDPDRDLQPCLPKLIKAWEPAGRITAEIAARTGLKEGTLVSAGGGDNMVAAIGTGNVMEGRLTASLGTSGTLFGYSNTPIIDPSGDLAAFCSSTGGWLPLLCTMNCTVATEQLRDLLGQDIASIDPLTKMVPAGADGLITLPFYNGERTPNLPNGKGVIYGLDEGNSTPGHLLRSAMEAGIFGLKTGLEAFERCGMTFTEVTLTGGGSKSSVWRQICADILALPVKALRQEENAAFGAALQALWCLSKASGADQSIESITGEHLADDAAMACQPNPISVSKYAEIYKKYMDLVTAMTPVFEGPNQ